MKQDQKIWEYTITQVQLMLQPPLDMKKPKNKESLDSLNKMGAEGWELIQIIPSQTGLTNCFWKRENRKKTAEWDV